MKPRSRVLKVSVADENGTVLDSVELTVHESQNRPAIDRVQVRLASFENFDPYSDADLMIETQQSVH